MTSPMIDLIDRLYTTWGHDNYSESVSQIAHGEQTAALAIESGSSEGLVLAALLHDIGHLLVLDSTNGSPRLDSDDNHESTGARFLATHFGIEVTAPIALHVAAKRYLCYSDAEYFATLSPASVASLRLQGGPMRGDEASRFERSPHFVHAVRLRRWDEDAKVVGLLTPSFHSYLSMMERNLVDKQSRHASV